MSFILYLKTSIVCSKSGQFTRIGYLIYSLQAQCCRAKLDKGEPHMADAYTTLWTHERCREARAAKQADAPLNLLFGGPHISQPSFRRAGVKVGDYVYPISVQRGIIYIIARLQVQALLTLEEYIEQHPKLFAPYRRTARAMETLAAFISAFPQKRYLFRTCTNEVLTGEGTPIRFDLAIPSAIVNRIRYRSQRGERPIKHLEDGKVIRTISIQGIYRLSVVSAIDFENMLIGDTRREDSTNLSAAE